MTMKITHQPTLVPGVRAVTLNYTDDGLPAKSITMFNASVVTAPATAPTTGIDATVARVDGYGSVMTDANGALTETANGATEDAAITAAALALAPRVLPVPAISGLSPVSGPVAGGTAIVIEGNNLIGTTAVEFGGAAAESFTVDSMTQITASAPAGSAGAVDVSVTAPGGTAIKTGAFTYE